MKLSAIMIGIQIRLNKFEQVLDILHSYKTNHFHIGTFLQSKTKNTNIGIDNILLLRFITQLCHTAQNYA